MGIGTRNEETGEYIFSEDLDNGHWYQDQNGNLYIIPDERNGIEGSQGPEGRVMTELNAVYRQKGFDHVDPDALANELGLEFISPVLHRFDEESGFYSA